MTVFRRYIVTASRADRVREYEITAERFEIMDKNLCFYSHGRLIASFSGGSWGVVEESDQLMEIDGAP